MDVVCCRDASRGSGESACCCGCAIGWWAFGIIGDGCDLGARGGEGFIEAKGVAVSVNGYGLVDVLGGRKSVDGIDGV